MSLVNNFKSSNINGTLKVKSLWSAYDPTTDSPAINATLVTGGNIECVDATGGSVSCNNLLVNNVIKTNDIESKSQTSNVFNIGKNSGGIATFVNIGDETGEYAEFKLGGTTIADDVYQSTISGRGDFNLACNGNPKIYINSSSGKTYLRDSVNFDYTPTCSQLPYYADSLCNKEYVDSKSNQVSTTGGYFTITGECSDISATKMYNWAFGGNRQGSSALVMDVALGCNCSLQYVYFVFTGPITVATTVQLLKNGSATSSYNFTFPVNTGDTTKIFDLSSTPIMFDRGDRFRLKTTAGNMALDALNNAGRMTMTFASSVYYSQEFTDLSNSYANFRDVTVPLTYATIATTNDLQTQIEGVADSLINNSVLIGDLIAETTAINAKFPIIDNSMILLNNDIDTVETTVVSLEGQMSNLNLALNGFTTILQQIVVNGTTGNSEELTAYQNTNDATVTDLSANHYAYKELSTLFMVDLSANQNSYKTNNDAKVNDVSNNLSNYKTSADNNISALHQKTAGFTYNGSNRTTFANNIQCNGAIYANIDEELKNINPIISRVDYRTSFLIFSPEGYNIYCPVGIMENPSSDNDYVFSVKGASQFKERVDISNAYIIFTQPTNGVQFKTNDVLNSSISDNGSLICNTTNRMLLNVGGINKLDISNDLVTVNTNLKITGGCTITGAFTTAEIQASTQKLTNVTYTAGSGHKFASSVGISTDPISGYGLVVNGSCKLQGEVETDKLVFKNQVLNGIEWKNNSIVNTSIYDDGTTSHLTSKNKFSVDISGVNIVDTNFNGVNVKKNIYLPTGSNGQIIWGESYSKIYDNADLHIQTDDNMWFDIGTTNPTNIMKITTNLVSITKPITVTGSVTVSENVIATGSLSCSNITASGSITGASVTANNYYINNINTGTTGFAMSNGSSFSDTASNKIRILNNNSSSYFDFTSSSDAKLHWRYGSTTAEFLTFDGFNGRVGINKTSPAYALDVNGDINISNLTSKILFNSGASSIYDDLQLHIKTDDNMYFDIGATNIMYVNSSSVDIKKKLNLTESLTLPVGKTISWGANESKIYDDGVLHVASDDRIWFDIKTSNAITLSEGRLAIYKDIITNTLDCVNGAITNYPNPVFTKSTLVITNINVSVNYKKEITINTPISSYYEGNTNAVITNSIVSMMYFVYNGLNQSVAGGYVTSSNGLNIQKSVNMSYDFGVPSQYFEQYFTNASFKFKPPFREFSDTYRVELIITGTGQWRMNTNVSSRVYNNPSIIFNNGDGSGYTSANYSESVYAIGKVGQVEVNHFSANQIVCGGINKTYLGNFNYNTSQGGGSTFYHTFPVVGLYMVTCGENYDDSNLLSVFYIYAGKANHSQVVSAIFEGYLTHPLQTGTRTFSIYANAPSNYTSFSISYQKIN